MLIMKCVLPSSAIRGDRCLKRPAPRLRHRMQRDKVTDRILQVYKEVGHTIPTVVPIVGYTERVQSWRCGETLGQTYGLSWKSVPAGSAHG